MRKGIGIRKTEPFPIPVNWGMLFPMMVAPRQKYITTERARMPTARVTMNGGSLASVMMSPFRSPKAVPTSRQARTASGRGTVGEPSGCTMRCRRIRTAPEVASTGPEERSIPPAMMTKVMPSAMAPTIEVLRRMLRRLSGWRNRGAAMPQMTMMAPKTTRML